MEVAAPSKRGPHFLSLFLFLLAFPFSFPFPSFFCTLILPPPPIFFFVGVVAALKRVSEKVGIEAPPKVVLEQMVDDR